MKCFDNSKNVAGLRTFKTTFLNAKTWLTLQSFYHFNILVNTSVETSAIAKKCEFCAKTVILESISAYVIVMFCKVKVHTEHLTQCENHLEFLNVKIGIMLNNS